MGFKEFDYQWTNAFSSREIIIVFFLRPRVNQVFLAIPLKRIAVWKAIRHTFVLGFLRLIEFFADHFLCNSSLGYDAEENRDNLHFRSFQNASAKIFHMKSSIHFFIDFCTCHIYCSNSTMGSKQSEVDTEYIV